jgi:hypothetical protein
MTDESILANKKEAMQRLHELVLDHLGMPRPKQSSHIQVLQNELLPAFIDLARHAWLASSPWPLKTGMPVNEQSHPVYRYLKMLTENRLEEINILKDLLEELVPGAAMKSSIWQKSSVGSMAGFTICFLINEGQSLIRTTMASLHSIKLRRTRVM